MCWVVEDMVGETPNSTGLLGSNSTSTGRAVPHTANSTSAGEAGEGAKNYCYTNLGKQVHKNCK